MIDNIKQPWKVYGSTNLTQDCDNAVKYKCISELYLNDECVQ